MMKKLIKMIPAIVFVMLPGISLAALSGGYNTGKTAAGQGSGLQSNVNLPEALQNIVYVGALLMGSLGVLGFLISGIIYVTSAGNEDRMETAKRAMMYSIIGVVVGALGFIAINAVETYIIGSGPGGGGTGPIVL